MDGLVDRQATLLAFERVFIMAGLAFMFVLPLLYFLKAPKLGTPAIKVDVHME
jgi:hypothetical protein